MEFVKSVILVVFGVLFLFFGVTFLLWGLCVVISAVLYVATRLFYALFSLMECPHCSKGTKKNAIRCSRCGSSLIEEEPQEELNPELYARVKTFVAEFWSTSAEKLNPNTLLADDLGIAGDDGYELLEAFCEEFEIQNMCEIDASEYFGTEGCNPFEIYVMLYYWIFDKEKFDNYGTDTSLTLRDLVKSAEAKRWMHPEAR
ncbi:MAG: DUF1493 family protein [Candidatus Poribacteria bacterium]|nr:DUF1493 family protein [Candidatus Poribacteria bacterium]